MCAFRFHFWGRKVNWKSGFACAGLQLQDRASERHRPNQRKKMDLRIEVWPLLMKSKSSEGRGRREWSNHFLRRRSPKGRAWLVRGDPKTSLRADASEGPSVLCTGTEEVARVNLLDLTFGQSAKKLSLGRRLWNGYALPEIKNASIQEMIAWRRMHGLACQFSSKSALTGCHAEWTCAKYLLSFFKGSPLSWISRPLPKKNNTQCFWFSYLICLVLTRGVVWYPSVHSTK